MDPSITTTVTTAGTGTVQPFPTPPAGRVAFTRYLLINAAGSGAFDFSFDNGTTWHLRAFSAGPYSETLDVPGISDASKMLVRRNGATDVAALVVELY